MSASQKALGATASTPIQTGARTKVEAPSILAKLQLAATKVWRALRSRPYAVIAEEQQVTDELRHTRATSHRHLPRFK
jgi:hypothetical protein